MNENGNKSKGKRSVVTIVAAVLCVICAVVLVVALSKIGRASCRERV